MEAVNEPKREEMELQERGKGEQQRNVNVAMCISCRLLKKEHTQLQLLSPPFVSDNTEGGSVERIGWLVHRRLFANCDVTDVSFSFIYSLVIYFIEFVKENNKAALHFFLSMSMKCLDDFGCVP